MGFFDFLRRDRIPALAEGPPLDRKLASLAKTATDKRAQAYDREQAIRELCTVGTVQAAQILLKRFGFTIDPSITDQEEKAVAFDGIVAIGKGLRGRRADETGPKPKEENTAALTTDDVAELRDAVVVHVLKNCKKAENLTWQVNILRELLADEYYEAELLALLSEFDTEYIRNVQPKIDLIAALENIVSEDVRLAVEEYFDDVNETVRFHAVETTFKQGNSASIAPLVELVGNEESVRIKNKVAEGMIRLGWSIPSELRERFRKGFEDVHEFRLADNGTVRKV